MWECDALLKNQDLILNNSILEIFKRSCLWDLVPFTVLCLEYARAPGTESTVTRNVGHKFSAVFLIVSIYWALTHQDGC